ncbi:hypothetical protein DPMN_098312 [Dreissena polymorpha]|uniref:Uncharacterized protein n=1 Tax=Dreissena polymorpha TaxID=45954 RepID=A0A9D4LBV5_DREPO|nr:hypothetical protein DPMN_098312 [Dreissena polymorpha]
MLDRSDESTFSVNKLLQPVNAALYLFDVWRTAMRSFVNSTFEVRSEKELLMHVRKVFPRYAFCGKQLSRIGDEDAGP